MHDRAGKLINNLSSEMKYFSLLPRLLPPDPPLEYDMEMVNLLTVANRSIGKLNGVSQNAPDIDLFTAMYIRKEALLSSQIEGTQATIDDILDPDIDANINQDIEEVLSYIKATHFAAKKILELPICNRFIKETHKILMANSRGEEKTPGEFRRSQNWIGPIGGLINNARFIPPNQKDMELAMSDLEKFINAEDDLDIIVKTALIHYQFETIHPFLDGNGRIGRLLISLFLMEQNILQYETLYISYYLKRHRSEYYDRLNAVRDSGHFEEWIKFFIRAVNESAIDAIDAIDSLVKLHNINTSRVKEIKGREGVTLNKVFRYIEHSPIINISNTSKELGMSYNAVSGAVNRLLVMQILSKISNQKRNRIFIYTDYLNILRKGTVD